MSMSSSFASRRMAMLKTKRGGAAEIVATSPLPGLPGSEGVPPALAFLGAGETPALPGRAGREIDLIGFANGRRFATILADPPWQFTNKTGKVAPEHKRLSRYGTMKLDDIMTLPIAALAAPTSHLYLWCPNAMLPDGLAVLQAWGFTYKANLVWHKIRKDGG